jgi:hypothetical protein
VCEKEIGALTAKMALDSDQAAALQKKLEIVEAQIQSLKTEAAYFQSHFSNRLLEAQRRYRDAKDMLIATWEQHKAEKEAPSPPPPALVKPAKKKQKPRKRPPKKTTKVVAEEVPEAVEPHKSPRVLQEGPAPAALQIEPSGSFAQMD